MQRMLPQFNCMHVLKDSCSKPPYVQNGPAAVFKYTYKNMLTGSYKVNVQSAWYWHFAAHGNRKQAGPAATVIPGCSRKMILRICKSGRAFARGSDSLLSWLMLKEAIHPSFRDGSKGKRNTKGSQHGYIESATENNDYSHSQVLEPYWNPPL
eukprot:1150286-Pelagomonas_calceolata.AAC.15